jgi:hypothetical protein
VEKNKKKDTGLTSVEKCIVQVLGTFTTGRDLVDYLLLNRYSKLYNRLEGT